MYSFDTFASLSERKQNAFSQTDEMQKAIHHARLHNHNHKYIYNSGDISIQN